jgi:hypothetical protein
MYSRACRCPNCQPSRLATQPTGPSVQASRPSFTPPVHRHGTSSLTFTSPSATASVLHTCTTQAKRHVAHKDFTKVALVTTQPISWITLRITHHKTNTQGYSSTLCSQYSNKTYHPNVPPMFTHAIITTTKCLFLTPPIFFLRRLTMGHAFKHRTM